jgi:opacity protein-like surface antigen
MTKKLLFVATIALVFAFAAMAADVTGKWTYEQPGRGGGPGRPVTITLKQDGSTLTGSVPGMGRGGDNPPPPSEITDGKVDGNNVSFTVKREFNGNTMTIKYEGTVNGDEMKLKITRDTQNGPMTNEVTAKRSTT